MAKMMKKKAHVAKKSKAKKGAPKVAKTLKAKPAAKEHGEGSFMWKLLKKKEAERLNRQEGDKGSKFNMHKLETQLPTGVQGYSRFAGPRRKAA